MITTGIEGVSVCRMNVNSSDITPENTDTYVHAFNKNTIGHVYLVFGGEYDRADRVILTMSTPDACWELGSMLVEVAKRMKRYHRVALDPPPGMTESDLDATRKSITAYARRKAARVKKVSK